VPGKEPKYFPGEPRKRKFGWNKCHIFVIDAIFIMVEKRIEMAENPPNSGINRKNGRHPHTCGEYRRGSPQNKAGKMKRNEVGRGQRQIDKWRIRFQYCTMGPHTFIYYFFHHLQIYVYRIIFTI
jgi:hypothetical protein